MLAACLPTLVACFPFHSQRLREQIHHLIMLAAIALHGHLMRYTLLVVI